MAAHFLVGPNLRWEVHEQADAPNGTLGALKSLDAITAFVRDVHAQGEAWVSGEVVPPAQRPEGSPAVYGARVTVTSGGVARGAAVKVVIDCATGKLSHMVGPLSSR